MISQRLFPLILSVVGISISVEGAASESGDTASSPTGQQPPFRHRSLDYWDAETLAAYLSVSPIYPHEALDDTTPIYAGNDAAVLFYAQWCNNCHSLAPMWDQIAGIVDAGTTSSNVIMALFDCEQQDVHKSLCSAAGITHYPTMLYIGKGTYHDTDPVSSTIVGSDRSAGPMGRSLISHTVKFQGDWRYGDQILDWMSVMKGLSSYSKWKDSGDQSFLGKLMKWIIRPFSSSDKDNNTKKNSKDGTQMPIGIPPQLQMQQALHSNSISSNSDNTDNSNSGSDSNINANMNTELKQDVSKLEQQVTTLESEKQQYEQGYTHNSLLIDLLLFPNPSTPSEETSKLEMGYDIFETLSQTWDTYPTIGTTLLEATSETDKSVPLLQSCVVEMTIDYCTRFITKNTMDAYDMLSADNANDPHREQRLDEIQNRVEPFCDIVENCTANDFSTEECRPQTCPLKNDMGCRYVSACFSPGMMEEYSRAYDTLFQELNGDAQAGEPASSSSSSSSSSGGWGFGN